MADEKTNGMARISVTLDEDTRRNARIAAAIEDMTLGEWCNKVLNAAADVAIPDDVKATMKLKARKKVKR